MLRRVTDPNLNNILSPRHLCSPSPPLPLTPAPQPSPLPSLKNFINIRTVVWQILNYTISCILNAHITKYGHRSNDFSRSIAARDD